MPGTNEACEVASVANPTQPNHRHGSSPSPSLQSAITNSTKLTAVSPMVTKPSADPEDDAYGYDTSLLP